MVALGKVLRPERVDGQPLPGDDRRL